MPCEDEHAHTKMFKPCSMDFYTAVTEMRMQGNDELTSLTLLAKFSYLVHSTLAFRNNMLEHHERIRFNESS